MTWRVRRVAAFDSPFVDPGRIAEARTMYGEDSPEWASEILGVTATRQRTSLIAMEDYHRALRASPLFRGERNGTPVLAYEPFLADVEKVRRQRAGEAPDQGRKVIAVDPSAGGDLCVAARRRGSALVELAELDASSEEAMAHGIIALMRADRADEILVERGGGYGRHAFDVVSREFRKDVTVRWWDPSGSPRERTCGNARAEIWLQFARLLAAGEISLIADRAGRLERALAAVSRRQRDDGRLLITPKETLVEELGWSPDAADATVICFSGFKPGAGDSDLVRVVPFRV